MKSVRRAFTVPFPIEHVYRTITDLDARVDWKPFLQLSGKPHHGAEVSLRFRFAESREPFSSLATVIAAASPTSFAWQTGIGWLIAFEERYELESNQGGTEVSYELRILGAFASMVHLLMRRTFSTVAARGESGLISQLSKATRQTGRSPTGQRRTCQTRGRAV